MADTEKLAYGDRRLVVRLLADAPKLAGAVAVAVAKRLHRVLRKEGGEALADVLTAAHDTLLAGFAASLRRDQDAVQAVLDCPGPRAPSRVRSTASRPSSGPCTAAPASASSAPESKTAYDGDHLHGKRG